MRPMPPKEVESIADLERASFRETINRYSVTALVPVRDAVPMTVSARSPSERNIDLYCVPQSKFTFFQLAFLSQSDLGTTDTS